MADDPNQIMMYSPDGKLGYVHADKVNAALDHKFERAIKVHDPNSHQDGWVRQQKALKALNAGFYVADNNYLFDNKNWPDEIQKQGRYKMTGHDGKVMSVPYGFVGSAARAGYVMSPEDRQTYVRDAAADPNLAPGIVGRNSAGQPIFGDKPAAQPGFLSSAGSALKQGAVGIGKLLDPRETPEEKERNKKSSIPGYIFDNALGMYVVERVAQGQIEEGQKAKQEFDAADVPLTRIPKTRDEKEHRELALGHALAAVLPGVGPWAASVGEKVGEQIGGGNKAGAAGTLTGNAVMYEAPSHLRAPMGDLLSKAVTSLPEGVRNGIRNTLGVTDKSEDLIQQFGEESKDVREKNEKATKEHLDKSAEAAQETQGNELAHEQEVGRQKADIKASRNEKAEKVNKDNERVKAKHLEDVKEAVKTNSEINNQIQEYQNLEKQIEEDTRKAFDADEQERLDAKKKENNAWDVWRKKAGQWRGLADPLIQAIEKIGVSSAEVRRLLARMNEDPATLTGTSAYSLARQAIIDKMNLPGNAPGAYDYSVLNPNQRSFVDAEMAKTGIQTPSASINLQPGGSVTLDELHRAKSVLRRHSLELRRAGKTIEAGEASQLADVFEDNEAQWSNDAGAFGDWQAAREETRNYNDTFGRDFNDPRTHLSDLEKRTNPDFIKEQESEENLQKMEQRNPQLAAEHRRIREERERLAKMEKPDALEKKRKDVPPPPTVNDLREGYKLQELPEPIDAEAQARGKVKEPSRNLGPDRPKPGEPGEIALPDGTKVPAETVKFIHRALRRYGKVGGWVLRSIVGGIALTATHGEFSSFGSTMLLGQAAITLLTDALRKPSVIEWLSKPSVEELQMIDSLNPEDGARLRQALVALASDEVSRKVAKMPNNFDPTMARFLLGASQKPTLDDLKRQVEKAKPAPLPPGVKSKDMTPKEQSPAPGPQSSVTPAGVTHLYDDRTGRITPV